MDILKRINRFYDTHRFGQPQIRIYHKNGKGKRINVDAVTRSWRYTIHRYDGLEIGGVNGAIEDWREILLPLLLIEDKSDKLIDIL